MRMRLYSCEAKTTDKIVTLVALRDVSCEVKKGLICQVVLLMTTSISITISTDITMRSPVSLYQGAIYLWLLFIVKHIKIDIV